MKDRASLISALIPLYFTCIPRTCGSTHFRRFPMSCCKLPQTRSTNRVPCKRLAMTVPEDWESLSAWRVRFWRRAAAVLWADPKDATPGISTSVRWRRCSVDQLWILWILIMWSLETGHCFKNTIFHAQDSRSKHEQSVVLRHSSDWKTQSLLVASGEKLSLWRDRGFVNVCPFGYGSILTTNNGI